MKLLHIQVLVIAFIGLASGELAFTGLGAYHNSKAYPDTNLHYAGLGQHYSFQPNHANFGFNYDSPGSRAVLAPKQLFRASAPLVPHQVLAQHNQHPVVVSNFHSGFADGKFSVPQNIPHHVNTAVNAHNNNFAHFPQHILAKDHQVFSTNHQIPKVNFNHFPVHVATTAAPAFDQQPFIPFPQNHEFTHLAPVQHDFHLNNINTFTPHTPIPHNNFHQFNIPQLNRPATEFNFDEHQYKHQAVNIPRPPVHKSNNFNGDHDQKDHFPSHQANSHKQFQAPKAHHHFLGEHKVQQHSNAHGHSGFHHGKHAEQPKAHHKSSSHGIHTHNAGPLGHQSGEHKATSYQSFVLHSYHPATKKGDSSHEIHDKNNF